ncbi:MAG: 8-oxo-dGTP diphosphatase MutT [Nitrospirae bacterium CG18_big_fil_WC_8_21_14_2_50_70_55]|nr:(deoxy)nucleoside triphosphate pyrophosphohydrolase [Deltaproteobacteria bacterium]OIP66769.1 MAG: hypothetical protein AUK30_01775 [Nitrospirae bacterium CG2_30_70_394]PIQ06365.1 MAG: 8-oxo-dGTP diphosphatase MutT [Nitrospirae bacterium CG18_big_fil_WC_8_21_14_2_50_70_55]PIU77344.1 MAG: 8-oxo-dGTP diphosphatase MutT [Nitrospirae bacterium CG06_land_8_20_14_3_00_70_43]PIW83900.1 MAG: 8-oxo-dGTP diphosphatase MutT [Nitrospirae bacterium CG_4_8_14_3_um_filter_70_85]PIX82812.1 MAG: 8-oxo-dGTP 
MDHHHVAIALISRHGRWLVQQRRAGVPLAGSWEFPGGKVEAGESGATALLREVMEEVGMAVTIDRALPPLTHDYADRRVTLHPFVCTATDAPVACEGQLLRWVTAEELANLEIPAANRALLSHLQAGEGAR